MSQINTAFCLQLELITLEGTLLHEPVQSFSFKGPKGGVGILFDHAPLLTLLHQGDISYVTATGEKKVLYSLGGLVEVKDNRIIVLADHCYHREELDKKLALDEELPRLQQPLNESEQTKSFHQLYARLAGSAGLFKILQEIATMKKRGF